MQSPKQFENIPDHQKLAAVLLVDRIIRPEESITIESIAKEVGVSRQAIYKWMNNDAAFIEYKQYLTTLALQNAHTDLAGVLIANLKKGNPSTKMMDLMAKMTPNALVASKQEVEIKEDLTEKEKVLERIKELRRKQEGADADE